MDPVLSEMLGPGSRNVVAKDKFSTAMVQNICASGDRVCKGKDRQFPDLEACMASLSAKPVGEWYRLQGESLPLLLLLSKTDKQTIPSSAALSRPHLSHDQLHYTVRFSRLHRRSAHRASTPSPSTILLPKAGWRRNTSRRRTKSLSRISMPCRENRYTLCWRSAWPRTSCIPGIRRCMLP